MASLKALSKGVFTLTSARADATRRINNGQSTDRSFPVFKTYNQECSKSDNELENSASLKKTVFDGGFSRRISTPELLRHVATIATIKVKSNL